MKILINLLFLFLLSFTYSQDLAVQEADKLIERKKYDSAYKILDKADPNNKDPEIAISKTELMLKFFTSSIMHQMFALKDLEPDEEIFEVRGSDGDYSMYAFSPDSVLLELIEKYPENYHLKKELGFFYHEVHLKYPDSWIIPDSTIIDNARFYYLEAYEKGVFDYWSTYGLGYIYLLKNDVNASIPFFEKSIDLNHDYPTSHYNLAYAYLNNNEKEKCIQSAKTAFELYDDPSSKSDAARMIAVVYGELELPEQAREYYLKADMIEPNNYYTLKPLLALELSLNSDQFNKRTKEFHRLAPSNPTIYQDLISIYSSQGFEEKLIHFFEEQHSVFSDDQKVNGNLYFYTALVQFNINQKVQSKSNFERARELFKTVFESNHRVFEVIDSYTKEL